MQPTPTLPPADLPAPVPDAHAPQGDAGTQPDVQPTAAPQSTPIPPTALTAQLTVQACTDFNADKACSLGEGIDGLPVALVNAETGALLGTKTTEGDGLAVFEEAIAPNAQLAVDVPYLLISVPFYSGQRGVDIVVPAPPPLTRLP